MGTKRTVLLWGFKYSLYKVICEKLRENGFSVSKCSEDFIQKNLVSRKNFDVLVLHNVDNNLLDLTGSKIRKTGIKIVLVTNSVRFNEKTINNIDEVVKAPYTVDEIVWAVNKLFTHRDYITVGDIAHLNKEDQEFVVNGVRMNVTRYEVNLLYYLMEGKGTIKKETLCRYLSIVSGQRINQRYLSTMVSRLRKKIKSNSGMDLIKAKRGLGYYCSII